MSDVKISGLPSSTGVDPASDFIPIVHNGTTQKITPNELISGSGFVTDTELAATTGATLVGFKQTGSTVARTVDVKLKETVSVKDFGAIGDGVTDDTAAIQAAINSTTSKEIYFPSGIYICTSTLTVSNPITLVGESASSSILKFSGCNGIDITKSNLDTTSNIVRNLSITTTDSGLYTGLRFSTTRTDPWKIPKIIIEHVRVSGYSVSGESLNEWLTAVSLTNADQGYINELTIKGKESAATSNYLPATTGLYINESTTISVNALSVVRVKTGVYITGQSEGVMLTNSHAVAVYSGIVMEGLVDPANNHQIHNVHIAPSYEGVRIEPISVGVLSNIHFFSNVFVLKRTESPTSGGLDNYKAFDISVSKSSFFNGTT